MQNLRRAVLKGPTAVWICVCYAILVAAVGAMLIFQPLFDGKVNPVFLVLFILAVAFVSFDLVRRRRIGRMVKRSKELLGDASADMVFTVTPAGVTYCTSVSGGAKQIPFQSFVKMTDKKECFLLETNENKRYVLPKSGFTVGTPQDFERFFREKGVK